MQFAGNPAMLAAMASGDNTALILHALSSGPSAAAAGPATPEAAAGTQTAPDPAIVPERTPAGAPPGLEPVPPRPPPGLEGATSGSGRLTRPPPGLATTEQPAPGLAPGEKKVSSEKVAAQRALPPPPPPPLSPRAMAAALAHQRGLSTASTGTAAAAGAISNSNSGSKQSPKLATKLGASDVRTPPGLDVPGRSAGPENASPELSRKSPGSAARSPPVARPSRLPPSASNAELVPPPGLDFPGGPRGLGSSLRGADAKGLLASPHLQRSGNLGGSPSRPYMTTSSSSQANIPRPPQARPPVREALPFVDPSDSASMIDVGDISAVGADDPPPPPSAVGPVCVDRVDAGHPARAEPQRGGAGAAWPAVSGPAAALGRRLPGAGAAGGVAPPPGIAAPSGGNAPGNGANGVPASPFPPLPEPGLSAKAGAPAFTSGSPVARDVGGRGPKDDRSESGAGGNPGGGGPTAGPAGGNVASGGTQTASTGANKPGGNSGGKGGGPAVSEVLGFSSSLGLD